MMLRHFFKKTISEIYPKITHKIRMSLAPCFGQLGRCAVTYLTSPTDQIDDFCLYTVNAGGADVWPSPLPHQPRQHLHDLDPVGQVVHIWRLALGGGIFWDGVALGFGRPVGRGRMVKRDHEREGGNFRATPVLHVVGRARNNAIWFLGALLNSPPFKTIQTVASLNCSRL